MSGGAYQFGGYVYDPRSARLSRGEVTRELRPKVNALLELLVVHAEEIVSRDRIIDALWGQRAVIEFDTGIAACVRELRQAFDALEPGGSRLLATVPTRGYKLNVLVAQVPSAEQPKAQRSGAVAIITALVSIVLVAVWFAATRDAAAPRLVILPIRDLSGGAVSQLMLDRVFEDLMLKVGPRQPDELAVISGLSARQMATDKLDAKAIGQRFEANLILDMTARRVEQQIVVTMSLVDGREDSVRWGQMIEFDAQANSTDIAGSLASVVLDAVGMDPSPMVVEPSALEPEGFGLADQRAD